MRLEFDESKHIYTVGGEVVPSVTHIIRFLNFDTAVNADVHLRDIAADRGSRIHEACTVFDFEGSYEDEDGDIGGYVQAYADFKRDYQIDDWLLFECPLTDGTVAGTPDRYGDIDGVRVVLDIKTGSKVNPHAVTAQMFAYSRLLEQNGYKPPEEQWCLQLKRDGTYTLRKYGKTDGQEEWELCKRLQEILTKRKD